MIGYLIFGILNGIGIAIWLAGKKENKKQCNCKHLESYFMGEDSHGLYCGKCGKIISEEFYK
jgi:ribosomal protein S27AE